VEVREPDAAVAVEDAEAAVTLNHEPHDAGKQGSGGGGGICSMDGQDHSLTG
jgi:hypothetical protein